MREVDPDLPAIRAGDGEYRLSLDRDAADLTPVPLHVHDKELVVVTPKATTADVLSTILFLALAPPDEAEALVAKAGPAAVLLASLKGTRVVENGWRFPSSGGSLGGKR
jgi:hypothetical protein